MKGQGEFTNYGEKAVFKTFADCIAYKEEKTIRPILGCMVPWMAAPDYPGMCKGRVPFPDVGIPYKLFRFINHLKDTRGLKVLGFPTAYLKSCLELKVNSRLNSKRRRGKGMEYGKNALHFQRTVKVTRYIQAYGLFDLVVEVGSSLGLWIGLSGLGVYDLILEVAWNLKKRIWLMR